MAFTNCHPIPSLMSLLSTNDIVSSTQQISFPSHLWYPLSLSTGARSFTGARQFIRGYTTEGNGTPPPPKINSQCTLWKGWSLVGPSPIGSELLTAQSWADNHIATMFMMAVSRAEDIFLLFISLSSRSYISSTLFSHVPCACIR